MDFKFFKAELKAVHGVDAIVGLIFNHRTWGNMKVTAVDRFFVYTVRV